MVRRLLVLLRLFSSDLGRLSEFKDTLLLWLTWLWLLSDFWDLDCLVSIDCLWDFCFFFDFYLFLCFDPDFSVGLRLFDMSCSLLPYIRFGLLCRAVPKLRSLLRTCEPNMYWFWSNATAVGTLLPSAGLTLLCLLSSIVDCRFFWMFSSSDVDNKE